MQSEGLGFNILVKILKLLVSHIGSRLWCTARRRDMINQWEPGLPRFPLLFLDVLPLKLCSKSKSCFDCKAFEARHSFLPMSVFCQFNVATHHLVNPYLHGRVMHCPRSPRTGHRWSRGLGHRTGRPNRWPWVGLAYIHHGTVLWNHLEIRHCLNVTRFHQSTSETGWTTQLETVSYFTKALLLQKSGKILTIQPFEKSVPWNSTNQPTHTHTQIWSVSKNLCDSFTPKWSHREFGPCSFQGAMIQCLSFKLSSSKPMEAAFPTRCASWINGWMQKYGVFSSCWLESWALQVELHCAILPTKS